MSADPPKTSWRLDRPFRLGDLEVHPASGEVRDRRGTERLRPLLVDILLRLAASPGEVVRRETLLDEVWPRRMVNDEVLSRAIAELRTALGDDARAARYIETLPKIGYRLVATVTPLDPAPPSTSSTASISAAPISAAPAAPASAPVPGAPVPRVRVRLAVLIGAGCMVAILIAGFVLPRLVPVPVGADLDRRIAAAQPFASDPALEVAPRFSPDGRTVAYAAGEGAVARIVILSLDGTQRREIGDAQALHTAPVFFPDGKRIAYWRARAGDCAIVEHDLATDATRTIVDCRLSPRARFDLSPDGKRLAFTGVTRAQFPAGLVLADVATGETTPFTAPEPGMGDDLYPRFSPDGKRIAYFHGSESHRQLWTAEVANAATAAAATRLEGLSYGVAWLGPQGPILAAADWFGFRALNVVDLATGEARMLGARGARFPDANARGELVYEVATYTANLWSLDPRAVDAKPRSHWPSTRYTNQAEFSPDGQRIAFVSNREGLEGIYLATLAGAPTKLALPAGYRHIRPHWSADGQAIYAVRIPNGPVRAKQEAVRIDVARPSYEVLEALGTQVVDVRESRDGRWVYHAEAAGHALRLLRAPRGDLGKTERLALPIVTEYQLNADRLVFAQPQLQGLTSCRLDTFACERLDIAVGDANRFDWALGERAIYFRQPGPEGSRLARFDLAAGKVDRTWDFAPTGFGGSVAVAPGEAVVLVSREERLTIDLMVAR